jgi:hypothetical protein
MDKIVLVKKMFALWIKALRPGKLGIGRRESPPLRCQAKNAYQ